MNVRLTKEQKIQILNAQDIYAVMQQILLRENKISRNQEHFWFIGLNSQNTILFIELLGLGATNRVELKPREVFRMAIYKMAVKAILVHNHPSGQLTPSEGDQDATDKLLKSGDLLGIEVLDHLIISENQFFSFQENGILKELMNNGRYQVVPREKAELQQWKIEIEKEKALLGVAKKMIKEGYDLKTIIKLTGLRKSDIEDL